MRRIEMLADEYTEVFRSPDPASVFCYSPGIASLPGGRLVATCDLGGKGVAGLPGAKALGGDGGLAIQGKVFTSDDGGRSWIWRHDCPLRHARPFVCGGNVCILGHNRDLGILISSNQGESWSEVTKLTHGQEWHQAPCNVLHAKGNVYLVMERQVYNDCNGWAVSSLAPVLLRAKEDADLTCRENWTFADELVFRDVCRPENLDYFGVPFFPFLEKASTFPAPGRDCAPIGWLETNVVRFTDPRHCWHDPAGCTFHLWMRAHTGGAGYAAIAKVVEREDGTMKTMLERVPSGKTALFLPCPGGQMKFHILQDEQTALFWLLSTQATDSMARPECLCADRYNLPNNERRRMQLHFSTNCVDWCFAGLVAAGDSDRSSRHYASMAIRGNDLHLLSRSGDRQAASAHNGNLITHHVIQKFRDLAY